MKRNYLSAEELQTSGLLMEVNRRFFHPLGLALCIFVEDPEHPGEDDDYPVGSIAILDNRDDLEGWYFGDFSDEDLDKFYSVEVLWSERAKTRVESLGYMVQPIPMDGLLKLADKVSNRDVAQLG